MKRWLVGDVWETGQWTFDCLTVTESEKMPEEWRVLQNKGGVHRCSNYRALMLMSHTMKYTMGKTG